MRQLISAAALLCVSCVSTVSTTEDVREALVQGEQQRVDRFVQSFLTGGATADRQALEDEREVATDVQLRIQTGSRISHYRVERVNDVFFCLLQVQTRTSTREILGLSGALPDCPGQDTCEVCNSLVHPLPPEIRRRLRDHWIDGIRR